MTAKRWVRKDWLKSPYAKSKAGDPDGALSSLLERWKITDYEIGQGKGPEGRRAIRLRCKIRGVGYRFFLQVLDADAKDDELLRQIKRALYYQLKSVLELSSVFFPLEEALFAFRELDAGGETVFEAATPLLAQNPDAGSFGRLLLEHKPAAAGA